MVDHNTFLSKFRRNPTTVSSFPLLSRTGTNDTTKSDQSTIFSTTSTETAATNVSAPKRFFKVRTRSSPGEFIVPTIPPAPEKNPDKLREIRDIAFEVDMTPRKPATKNIHPLDQPILRRKYTSGQEELDSDKYNLQNAADLVAAMVRFMFKTIQSAWNLELFINVALTKNTTTRIHVPSLVMGLFGIYLLTHSSTPQYYQPQAVQNSSALRLGPVFIFIALLAVAAVMFGQGTQEEVPEPVTKKLKPAAPTTAPYINPAIEDDDDDLMRSESFKYEGFVRRAARYDFGWDLESDLLSGQLLVNRLECVKLVIDVRRVLRVQENLGDFVTTNKVSDSLSNDLSWEDQVFQDLVVNSSQGSGSWSLLGLSRSSTWLWQDSSLSQEDNVSVRELLLQFSGQGDLNFVESGEQWHWDKNDNSLFVTRNFNLLDRLELERSQVSLQIWRVGF